MQRQLWLKRTYNLGSSQVADFHNFRLEFDAAATLQHQSKGGAKLMCHMSVEWNGPWALKVSAFCHL